MPASPESAEVLAWLQRTGGTPADAVKHFWPRAKPAERKKVSARVRQWLKRSRDSTAPSPTTSPPPQFSPQPRPTSDDLPEHIPDFTAAEVAAEAFYERMVADLQADLSRAREVMDLKAIPSLNRELRQARAELENARGPGRRPVKLDRGNPADVADRLHRLFPLLSRLAAAKGRRPDVIDAEDPDPITEEST